MERRTINTIIAFDPGKTTGWCVFRDKVLIADGTLTMEQSPALILDDFPPDLVIYESFRLFPNKAKAMIGAQFEPVQVIGVIRFLCQERHIPMIEQAPVLKKFFMPVARLKYYGSVPQSEHARDAVRHVLYYLVFKTKTLPLPKEQSSVDETSVRTSTRHSKVPSPHGESPVSSQLLWSSHDSAGASQRISDDISGGNDGDLSKRGAVRRRPKRKSPVRRSGRPKTRT